MRAALHAAAGDLDPTFGNLGIVTTDFGNTTDDAHEVAVQPDGKIVVAGSRGRDFAVARYNVDGSLDATFGTGGIVRTDFGSPNNEGAVSVAIDSVGRIVAVGGTTIPFSPTGRDFAVARYNPDGTLDTTFDGDGRVISISASNFDDAADVAIQSDDRIVVLGFLTLATSNFALVRYNTDGSLDTTFGGTGVVTTNFGGTSNTAAAMVVQPDGKVLAVGTVIPPGNRNFALVRYNADGSPDSSFGIGGHVTTNFNPADRLTDVALQADGKIVVGGSSGGLSGSYFTVARYEADGTVDVSFGVGGLVTTFFYGFTDFVRGLAIQADGKILAAGQTALAPGNVVTDFALVRYEGAP